MYPSWALSTSNALIIAFIKVAQTKEDITNCLLSLSLATNFSAFSLPSAKLSRVNLSKESSLLFCHPHIFLLQCQKFLFLPALDNGRKILDIEYIPNLRPTSLLEGPTLQITRMRWFPPYLAHPQHISDNISHPELRQTFHMLHTPSIVWTHSTETSGSMLLYNNCPLFFKKWSTSHHSLIYASGLWEPKLSLTTNYLSHIASA